MPIDIIVSGETKVITITGPNTGGKTAAMKTLGLAALMAKCGPRPKFYPYKFIRFVVSLGFSRIRADHILIYDCRLVCAGKGIGIPTMV